GLSVGADGILEPAFQCGGRGRRLLGICGRDIESPAGGDDAAGILQCQRVQITELIVEVDVGHSAAGGGYLLAGLGGKSADDDGSVADVDHAAEVDEQEIVLGYAAGA